MKNVKRFVILSSMLLAGFAASACDDDVNGDKICVENAVKCQDDAVLLVCKDNVFVKKQTCDSSKNEICVLDACIDKTAPQCNHTDFKSTCLDAKTLKICTDADKLGTKACAKGCSNGACTGETEVECVHTDYKSICADAKTLKICTVDNKLSTETCANGCANNACVADVVSCTATSHPSKCLSKDKLEFCNLGTSKVEQKVCDYDCMDGACAPKCDPLVNIPNCQGSDLMTCSATSGKMEAVACPFGCFDATCLKEVIVVKCVPACSKSQVCTDGKCVDAVAATEIGKACTCAGPDCDIVINGDELKAVAPFLLGSLKAGDKITAPNFFSKNIKGCEGVDAPAGMTVGCFRTSKISFDQKIIDQIAGLLVTFGPMVPNMPEGIGKTLETLLGKGIDFTSKDGYCLAATINIKATIVGLVAAIIQGKPLNAMMDKIATGDHTAAHAAVCPAGTSKFSYTINENVDGFGAFNVGFDLCLKSCVSKTDCREGYDCIEIPDGVPGEGQTTADLVKKNVCFDKANVDYFGELTNLFAPKP